MNNIFTSSVTFKLCERDDDGNLVDTEEIRIQNVTIDGINYINSYIRQAYLTAQRDATKGWDKHEREEFMKLAMKHVMVLSVGTKEGNDILFNTLDGMLHWTWLFVRHRFSTVSEWDKVFRCDVKVYNEIMNRFNEAVIQLALLTGDETHSEIPEVNENPEGLDWMITALVASGMSLNEAKQLTPEQAEQVLMRKYPELAKPNKPDFKTDDPEEFKAMLAKQLNNRSYE